jgi:hypothetical protein
MHQLRPACSLLYVDVGAAPAPSDGVIEGLLDDAPAWLGWGLAGARSP